MISEQITVTTTKTTIAALLATVRGAAAAAIPSKCVRIMLRYDRAETAIVSISDAASVAGAVILDAATEILLATSFKQFAIDKVFLSCDTGTVTVHVIIEQALK